MDTFELPLTIVVGQLITILAIAYAIKAVVDARVRTKLIASNPSETLIHALLDERSQRQRASLRWGVLLLCLACGFGLIQVIGWLEVTPGAIGILLAATGVGNLLFYAIERKWPPDERSGTPST